MVPWILKVILIAQRCMHSQSLWKDTNFEETQCTKTTAVVSKASEYCLVAVHCVWTSCTPIYDNISVAFTSVGTTRRQSRRLSLAGRAVIPKMRQTKLTRLALLASLITSQDPQHHPVNPGTTLSTHVWWQASHDNALTEGQGRKERRDDPWVGIA